MSLPKPKAMKGDTVHVLDYRRRPAVWVSGEVSQTELSDLHQARGVYRWTYTVLVPQARDAAAARRLYVSDNQIRLESRQ